MSSTPATDQQLDQHSERLRALHVPGDPLVLPNAWDAASARAVEEAGFPVVATSSAAVAPSLGYQDHHGAPPAEMLAAAGRIARAVDLPVTVDAEGGYGMSADELVAALADLGAAGFNLEDSDHSAGELRDPDQQAGWLAEVRAAASAIGYRPVINARIDVFLAHRQAGEQLAFVPDGIERARAYAAEGADCVYPIALWETEALGAFMAEAPAPVNVLPMPDGPSLSELAEMGVARISYASRLYRETMEQFANQLATIPRAV
ncbi:MAG TPA: isocitrate lyase/phosphoenolpyruvate mutase family protein [Solirubrobacterales bacterium]|jgi:2-methylisocitrate lyase-like PEP mutase family enzyme